LKLRQLGLLGLLIQYFLLRLLDLLRQLYLLAP
jgi:hypothetical protein